jgi:hypothetical protein
MIFSSASFLDWAAAEDALGDESVAVALAALAAALSGSGFTPTGFAGALMIPGGGWIGVGRVVAAAIDAGIDTGVAAASVGGAAAMGLVLGAITVGVVFLGDAVVVVVVTALAASGRPNEPGDVDAARPALPGSGLTALKAP